MWTHGSLPLRVSVTLGAKNGLDVWSAGTRLLELRPADTWLDVSLLLPTEEVLRIRVDERSCGARRAE